MEFMYSLPMMAGTAFLTLFVVTVLGRGLGLYWLQPLTWLADAFKFMGRIAAWIGRKIGAAVVWVDWALRKVLDRLWPSIRDTCKDVWVIASGTFVVAWKLGNGVREAVVDAYHRGLVAFPWLWELGQSVFCVLVATAAVYVCRWLPEPFVRAYLHAAALTWPTAALTFIIVTAIVHIMRANLIAALVRECCMREEQYLPVPPPVPADDPAPAPQPRARRSVAQ